MNSIDFRAFGSHGRCYPKTLTAISTSSIFHDLNLLTEVHSTYNQICKLFEQVGRSFGENPQADTDNSRLSLPLQRSSKQSVNSTKVMISFNSVSLVIENLAYLDLRSESYLIPLVLPRIIHEDL